MLWVQRGKTAPFLPGFHSFPGGVAEIADAVAPHSGGDDVALRVAALRELFEETGVLVVEGDPRPSRALEQALRAQFAKGAAAGTAAMVSAGLRWATHRLVPAGRWCTPRKFPIRFDARFFGLEVAEPPPLDAELDELDGAEMIRPVDALAAWSEAAVLIGPPAVAVLRVMATQGAFDGPRMRSMPGADGRESLRFEVVPYLQLLPLRTPTLPPATHTNAYLVGSRDAVLIEPASPDDAELRLTLDWIAENAAQGITVRALMLTHHHIDHVGGALLLRERLGLPVWAHADTAQRLAGKIPVDRALVDGEVLTLEGPSPIALEVMHTPGHASGHLCFFEPRSRAMVVGDMVASVGTILIEPDGGDMTAYLASLERMAARAPRLLLPAHGFPIRDAVEKLLATRAHRLMREAKILALLGRDGPGKTIAELVPAAYDDAPAAVWPLAVLSLEAHLIRLERNGQVRRQAGRYAAEDRRQGDP